VEGGGVGGGGRDVGVTVSLVGASGGMELVSGLEVDHDSAGLHRCWCSWCRVRHKTEF
jgi:hypothetical protein